MNLIKLRGKILGIAKRLLTGDEFIYKCREGDLLIQVTLLRSVGNRSYQVGGVTWMLYVQKFLLEIKGSTNVTG